MPHDWVELLQVGLLFDVLPLPTFVKWGTTGAGPGSCALSADARWEASQLETSVQLSKMVPSGAGAGQRHSTDLHSDSGEHLWCSRMLSM